MSYLPRTSGQRWVHDPASHGIFIHGGSNYTAKWYSATCEERKADCNRFMLTLPSSTKTHKDDSPEMQAVRNLHYRAIKEPTFQRALRRAIQFRRDNPVLASCAIYACTDFQYARSQSSGILGVQLVAAPETISPQCPKRGSTDTKPALPRDAHANTCNNCLLQFTLKHFTVK